MRARFYFAARPGSGSSTGLVARIDYTSLWVLITANGIHGMQTIASGNPLTVAIAFSPGSATLNQGEFYVGVASDSGQTLWIDPLTGKLKPDATYS